MYNFLFRFDRQLPVKFESLVLSVQYMKRFVSWVPLVPCLVPRLYQNQHKEGCAMTGGAERRAGFEPVSHYPPSARI